MPSQTELLSNIGLNEEVIGITKFCVLPDSWYKSKTRIGGTKKLNIEKIKSLSPDLIIGNKEENNKEQIEELMKLFPVWMSDIRSLEDALQMIASLGEITGTKKKAAELVLKIQEEFSGLGQEMKASGKGELKVAYLIWRRPYFAAGAGTFIDDMLSRIGLKNIFAEHESRYPETDAGELRVFGPDIILLSSEPYPFRERHINEFRSACPEAKILFADGQLFSWYGSRLLLAPAYFRLLAKNF